MLGTIGLEIAIVFYNSFLPHIAPPDYLGRISGWAWGSGYFGGIIALVIVLFVFIKQNWLGLDNETAAPVRICGPFTGLCLDFFALPLFFIIKDSPPTNLTISKSIRFRVK